MPGKKIELKEHINSAKNSIDKFAKANNISFLQNNEPVGKHLQNNEENWNPAEYNKSKLTFNYELFTVRDRSSNPVINSDKDTKVYGKHIK